MPGVLNPVGVHGRTSGTVRRAAASRWGNDSSALSRGLDMVISKSNAVWSSWSPSSPLTLEVPGLAYLIAKLDRGFVRILSPLRSRRDDRGPAPRTIRSLENFPGLYSPPPSLPMCFKTSDVQEESDGSSVLELDTGARVFEFASVYHLAYLSVPLYFSNAGSCG